jgi:hypothetical protein
VKVLFDHCVDRRFRRLLPGHEILTTQEMGWASYKNGTLLSAAEGDGFAMLLTVDRNIQHQQNMTGRTIAILVMVASSNRLEDMTPLAPTVLTTLAALQPGQIVTVSLPDSTATPSPTTP